MPERAPHPPAQEPRPWRRVAVAGVASVGMVVGALWAPGFSVLRDGDVAGRYDRATEQRVADAAAVGDSAATRVGADGHDHDHSDPTTKNDISRSVEQAGDPTSPEQAIANASYVRGQRDLADPTLTTVPLRTPRQRTPEDRWAMAGGCYTLTTPAGHHLVEGSDGPAFADVPRADAARFRFQAVTLGRYLLYGTDRDFVSGPGRVTLAEAPARTTEWTALPRADRRYALRLRAGEWLRRGPGGAAVTGERPTRLRLVRAGGCATFPESGVGVSGRPHAGVTSYQEVRGYADAHTHGMAHQFLGGAHCGRPWHPYGVEAALVDCPDHQTGTNVLESFLSGRPHHDPVGWPTFKDWPAPDSLTHEGTYWKWMERSWRGGQRLFVNLLVENNQLCRVYKVSRADLADLSCDEMDSVRRQARDMRAFQDYVDAQWGGPGEGWYRIVTSPWQARRVINQGKLAVVMGIETSVPFGCTFKALPGGDRPAASCTRESIDAQLAEAHRMGVRQMELVNKFDNAFSGIAGDEGATGVAVNGANRLETNTAWDMRRCSTELPDGVADKEQYAAPDISPQQQDALFGAIGQLYGITGAVPLYGPTPHCNARGLSDLGSHLVDRLMQRGMMIDPDHMSVKARRTLLDQVEEAGYPGIMSSHSWSTPDAYPRILAMGGFIAPYAGDSTGFVDKWRRHLEWADERYFFGLGFGADINGLGAQGDPRGAGVPNPVTYPFTGLNGVRMTRQRSGERRWDLNVDGVAHYGLYPDWMEDLRLVADAQAGDGDAILGDMARGAEAYLQTWERAQGVAPDSCRNPSLRKRVAVFRDLVRPGMGVRAVLGAVGQPHQRLGREFTYCARTRAGAERRLTVALTDAGRVVDVARAG